MKSLLCCLVMLFMLTCLDARAQVSAADDPDWAELMKDGSMSYEAILSLHRSRWPVMPAASGQGFKPFARWAYMTGQYVNENGHWPSGTEVVHAWSALRSYNADRSLSGNWKQLGPILDGVTTRERIEGVGRTSHVAFHPTDPAIVFLGTPAGGLWRSTDGGHSWFSTTDNFPTLGVSAIAFDPANPQTIYIGTGDRDAADAPGMGVMKSTDGGETWAFCNTGIENYAVGVIRMLGSGAILIGTNEGIYRSTDAGVSWVQTSSNTVDYRDIDVHPTNPQIIYATGGGKFFRSTDEGQSWDWVQEGINSSTRMVIAVSPVQPDYVYVVRANTYSFMGLYRSTDAGQNFTEMSDSPNILGWAADGSSEGGQAWYDLCIEADHEEPDVLYVGGIRAKKSVDGGATWTDINPNYLHVDQHEFVISPHNKDLYAANDGGIYHYINNEEWLDISNNLVNGQIYKLGQSPHDPNQTLTGFQDNGTAEFNGAYWQRRGGGDGFECAYDITDEAWRYGSIYYGDLFRTSPDFVNEKFCGFDVNGITESGAWSTPFVLSQEDPNTMFVGLKNVWRSYNIKHPEKDSIAWMKISSNLGGNDAADLNALEISSSDPNILFAAEPNSKLFRTLNCHADTVVWQNISSGLPVAYSPVRSIETHPTDTQVVYIAYHNNAYKSTDLGVTWENITPNLPDVPMNSIVLDTSGADEALYLGTNLGIYYKDASMTDWIPFNSGFPDASRVTELEIFFGPTHETSRIKAATYGRGLWESDLYGAETQFFPPVALITSTEETGEVFGGFDVTLSFHRQLETIGVTGLQAEDLWVLNGTVTDDTYNAETLTSVFHIEPDTFGVVKVLYGDSLAIDLMGNPNLASDTLTFYYSPIPEAMGIAGPGGVGDNDDLVFWLRADSKVYDEDGVPAGTDGAGIGEWRDKMGGSFKAEQDAENEQPTLLLGNNGINGRAALYFDGDNDWMIMEDVVPGRSLSGYAMVKGDSIDFNDHGWMASARVPNGYLMHPWKHEPRYSAEVLDLEEQYSGGPVYYIEDAASPRMYGFIYHQDDFHQVFHTVFDDQRIAFPGVEIGLRDNTTPIDIRIGWDYEDRYGMGRIAEHFLYNQRLMVTHHNLVANYMAARYGLDIGPLAKYDHPAQPLEVFGIGRESEYDFHADAQGPGIVRVTDDLDAEAPYYLLIGDDGGSLQHTGDSYPILSSRLERTWGYTETGENDAVQVRVLAGAFEPFENPGLLLAQGDAFVPGEPVLFIPLENTGDYLEAYVDFEGSGVFSIGEPPVVSVEELQQADVVLYPNPAEDTFSVQWLRHWPAHWTLRLSDPTGRTVLRQQCSGTNAEVDISGLSPGMYHCTASYKGHQWVRLLSVR